MSEQSGKDLSKIFDQYLRTTMIPVLEYKFAGDTLSYRWANCVEGFDMPVSISGEYTGRLQPTTSWQNLPLKSIFMKPELTIDRNFYITVKKVE